MTAVEFNKLSWDQQWQYRRDLLLADFVPTCLTGITKRKIQNFLSTVSPFKEMPKNYLEFHAGYGFSDLRKTGKFTIASKYKNADDMYKCKHISVKREFVHEFVKEDHSNTASIEDAGSIKSELTRIANALEDLLKILLEMKNG